MLGTRKIRGSVDLKWKAEPVWGSRVHRSRTSGLVTLEMSPTISLCERGIAYIAKGYFGMHARGLFTTQIFVTACY